MTKRLFRQRHPIFTGFIILGIGVLLFWGGIAFIVSMATGPTRMGIIPGRQGVGVVDLKGLIVSPEEIIKKLQTFRKSRTVRAIVLRVDSPGGAVGASQEIFEEVKQTNQAKPVVASLGSIAASGGYYASLGAERIIADPGTLTGSIGVILKFPNFEKIFKKVGYRTEVIKSGRLKDIGANNRPMNDDERALLQKLIDNVHDQFIKAVADHRGLKVEDVRELADGRVFSGEQAKDLGLVDELGNFSDAVKLAARLSGLNEDMPHIIYPKEETSLLQLLTGRGETSLFNGLSFHYPLLSYEWAL